MRRAFKFAVPPSKHLQHLDTSSAPPLTLPPPSLSYPQGQCACLLCPIPLCTHLQVVRLMPENLRRPANTRRHGGGRIRWEAMGFEKERRGLGNQGKRVVITCNSQSWTGQNGEGVWPSDQPHLCLPVYALTWTPFWCGCSVLGPYV